MDADVIFLLVIVGNFAVSIGTIIYAYSKHHDKFVLVLVLCTLGGMAGSLIAFLLISAPRLRKPMLGEAEVESCPHCGTGYLSSDYREDAAIICSDCHQQIREALAPGVGYGSL